MERAASEGMNNFLWHAAVTLIQQLWPRRDLEALGMVTGPRAPVEPDYATPSLPYPRAPVTLGACCRWSTRGEPTQAEAVD
jgi:hypothetical protein